MRTITLLLIFFVSFQHIWTQELKQTFRSKILIIQPLSVFKVGYKDFLPVEQIAGSVRLYQGYLNHWNLINSVGHLTDDIYLSLETAIRTNPKISDKKLEIYDVWKLKKSEDDIQIYFRWIKVEPDKKNRQMRSEMVVDAPLSSIVGVIKDDNKAKIWVSRVKEFYHFDMIDYYNWYTYTEFSLPWPLVNQDLVIKNQLIQDPKSLVIEIDMKCIPDYLPEKKNTKRFLHFQGIWRLIPLPGRKTKIEYLIFTKMKPVLPMWITDPIVVNGLWNTMDKMRDLILENKLEMVQMNYKSNQNIK